MNVEQPYLFSDYNKVLDMNKSIFVVTIAVAVIALAMIMSTVVTSDGLADSKKDRANKVLDKHTSAGGDHGDKAREIKNKLNRGGDGGDGPNR